MKNKLRVGVLIDSFDVPAWTRLLLQQVRDSDFADVALVVVNAGLDGLPPRSMRGPALGDRDTFRGKTRHFLESSRRHIMERHASPNHACEPASAKAILDGVPAIRVAPDPGLPGLQLGRSDIVRISEQDLDVILRFGFEKLSGDILDVAEYGLWEYHLADSSRIRDELPGFWETMEEWPETGCELQRRSRDATRSVALYRSWSCTNTRSVWSNNNARLWTAASFVPRVLARLHALGGARFEAELSEDGGFPESVSHRPNPEPSNADLFFGVCKQLFSKTARRLRHELYFDQWVMLYAFGSPMKSNVADYVPLIPPADRFWADPNVVFRDGQHYVFFEELLYRDGLGHISCMRIDENGKHGAVVEVLKEPHHLSYPFIFQVDGVTYMLVEAMQSRTVPLYRCVSFPDKWVFEKNLLDDLAAVDPTLYRHAGKWYLFVNVAENPGSSEWDELFLFFTDDPIHGNWLPHPLNPIVSDVRRARPAGPLFESGGTLYRPSQDCSRHYGFALNLNRITKMDPEGYEEEVVHRIEPSWSNLVKSVHTMSNAGGLTILDAQRRRARRW